MVGKVTKQGAIAQLVGRTPPSALPPQDIEIRRDVKYGRKSYQIRGYSTVGRTKVNLLTPTDGEASIAPTTMDDGKSGRKSYQMGH